MSDQIIIKDDEELIAVAKEIFGCSVASDIKYMLSAIRSFVADHCDSIRASVYDEVIDILKEKREFTKLDIQSDLQETIQILHPQK